MTVAFTEAPDGTHLNRTTCTWSGSTGLGYGGFSRAHTVTAAPADSLATPVSVTPTITIGS